MNPTQSLCAVGYSPTAPTEQALAILPKSYRFDGTVPGILLMHGAGSLTSGDIVDYGATPNACLAVKALAAAGYPILYPFAGGNTWGNDTVIARMAEAKTYLQGTLAAKAGKIVVMGLSHGQAAAFAYTKANPTLVSCLLGWNGVVDLQDMVSNNRGGFASQINGCYSGGYSDATYGNAHSPLKIAQSGAFPVKAQLYAPNDDATVVVQSTVTALTAALGAQGEVHATTGGHTDTAYGQVDVNAVLTFLAANA